jgi:hypothetical protein
MTTTQRIYKNKDVDMLVTASTILESAIANKVFLVSKRATWADPFLPNLKIRINAAIQTHLGVDSAKDLRQSTQVLLSVQKSAIKDLAECKVQIAEDFKSDKIRRDEILNQLGFASYHRDAQKGDQEALINLLYQFKTNLSASLKTEITSKGTASVMLAGIVAYADVLKNADVSQETYKGTRKVITAAANKEFNEIYDQVISICKISTKFYKDRPEMKDQFTYAKVAKVLNATSHATPSAPPVTPP